MPMKTSRIAEKFTSPAELPERIIRGNMIRPSTAKMTGNAGKVNSAGREVNTSGAISSTAQALAAADVAREEKKAVPSMV